MKFRLFIGAFIIGFLISGSVFGSLEEDFVSPPDSARPGVYWYFMDGNQNREEMVADLHAMKEVGIGSVLFLEVNIGIPTGPVSFMSEQWQDNVVHAIKTTEKLEMEFILGTGPGWSGSGGSWVMPQDSMQHLVGGMIEVQGPVVFDKVLPVPAPHKPNHFAGMSESHSFARDQWYRDVTVLAFPTPSADTATIGTANTDLFNIKTLKDVRPYSIRRTDILFVMPQADYPDINSASVIDANRIIDLTSKMNSDGKLRWDVPPGDWTIMRFVSRSTGQTTRPAPRAGHGFECDKFSTDAYRQHWDNYQGRLIKKLGPLTPGKGLTTIHLDSWEMSSQNWSHDFRSEFKKRRGYDPQPFYPAYMGLVVDSLEKTERFLWDMRKTSQELVLENHAGVIKKIAHEHGLKYSNQPYDMNPAGNLDLGSVADIPACEFWNALRGHDTQYSCIEAVSIANTMGRSRVNAEAFTTGGMRYLNYPSNMKNQTDWAFAMGINGIIFHTFQHQPLGQDAKPGMTMGPYGVQWHRNRPMWEMFDTYHKYITRCSNLLRQGQAVADILYLTPEGSPHIFNAPESAMAGSARLSDKKGYNFDAVSPRILEMRAKVKNGKITFQNGTSYSLLVLPKVETMTPETLELITNLIKAGATVIGNPPRKSPSLVNYPKCDDKVKSLAENLWGKTPLTERRVGKGRIILNADSAIQNQKTIPGKQTPETPTLYPDYDTAAAVLKDMGIAEDFTSTGPIRYGHRTTQDQEIYFVSNTSDDLIDVLCTFRVSGKKPQLWNPVTGETRILPQYTIKDGLTTIPMQFHSHESFFVIFSKEISADRPPVIASVNFPDVNPAAQIEGPWQVSFDPKWGGPENITFDNLIDWTTHAESGIKYYSGIAAYNKTFDADIPEGRKRPRVYLDLGTVHDMAKVTLNGKDLGIVWCAPWRVDITDAVKAKNNKLQIEIVNRWSNRMLGDTMEPDKDVRTLKWESGMLGGKEYKTGRYTFSTFPGPGKLLKSGLIGPVRVMVEQR